MTRRRRAHARGPLCPSPLCSGATLSRKLPVPLHRPSFPSSLVPHRLNSSPHLFTIYLQSRACFRATCDTTVVPSPQARSTKMKIIDRHWLQNNMASLILCAGAAEANARGHDVAALMSGKEGLSLVAVVLLFVLVLERQLN